MSTKFYLLSTIPLVLLLGLQLLTTTSAFELDEVTKHVEELIRAKEICLDEYVISLEEFTEIVDNNGMITNNLKCAIRCYFKQLGVLLEDGLLKSNRLLDMVENEGTSEEELKEIMYCIYNLFLVYCEDVFFLLRCLHPTRMPSLFVAIDRKLGVNIHQVPVPLIGRVILSAGMTFNDYLNDVILMNVLKDYKEV